MTDFSIVRNTPAYAGKTRRQQAEKSRDEKHPRVCGEDLTAVSQPATIVETPPRMRGRPVERVENGFDHRNTPAYAGKTEGHRLIL